MNLCMMFLARTKLPNFLCAYAGSIRSYLHMMAQFMPPEAALWGTKNKGVITVKMVKLPLSTN